VDREWWTVAVIPMTELVCPLVSDCRSGNLDASFVANFVDDVQDDARDKGQDGLLRMMNRTPAFEAGLKPEPKAPNARPADPP
jgi:hypothetical protein